MTLSDTILIQFEIVLLMPLLSSCPLEYFLEEISQWSCWCEFWIHHVAILVMLRINSFTWKQRWSPACKFILDIYLKQELTYELSEYLMDMMYMFITKILPEKIWCKGEDLEGDFPNSFKYYHCRPNQINDLNKKINKRTERWN